MQREEIESGVASLVEQFRDRLPPEQVDEMLSLIRAGEPGVALENLCTQIAEHEMAVPGCVRSKIREFGEVMGLDDTYWLTLKLG